MWKKERKTKMPKMYLQFRKCFLCSQFSSIFRIPVCRGTTYHLGVYVNFYFDMVFSIIQHRFGKVVLTMMPPTMMPLCKLVLTQSWGIEDQLPHLVLARSLFLLYLSYVLIRSFCLPQFVFQEDGNHGRDAVTAELSTCDDTSSHVSLV